MEDDAVLARAKEILIERGLTKGAYTSDTGCVCALGAVAATYGVFLPDGSSPRAELPGADAYVQFRRVAQRLADAVKALHPTAPSPATFGPGPVVSQFNDAEGTTLADVVEVFDHALAAA